MHRSNLSKVLKCLERVEGFARRDEGNGNWIMYQTVFKFWTRLPKIMALFYYVHEEPSSERAESRTVQLRAYTIAEFEEIQIPASAYSTSHSLTTWIKCARLNSKEDEPLLSPSRQRTWIHVHVEFTISPLVFWTRHQCRG